LIAGAGVVHGPRARQTRACSMPSRKNRVAAVKRWASTNRSYRWTAPRGEQRTITFLIHGTSVHAPCLAVAQRIRRAGGVPPMRVRPPTLEASSRPASKCRSCLDHRSTRRSPAPRGSSRSAPTGSSSLRRGRHVMVPVKRSNARTIDKFVENDPAVRMSKISMQPDDGQRTVTKPTSQGEAVATC